MRGFEEDMFHFSASKKINDTKYRSTNNRGLLKEDLLVKFERARRFTDGEWDSKGYSALSGGSCRLNDSHDLEGTPIGKLSENVEVQTPSAPPFMNIGNDCDSELRPEARKALIIKHKELEQKV